MTQTKPTHRPTPIKCGYRHCDVLFVPNPKQKSHIFHSPNCRVREWQCRHFGNADEIERLRKRIAELEDRRTDDPPTGSK